MHDVGRSFIPIEELKREISLLSRYKINVFHWHLTENQAWRLESKRYPQLNAPENMEREQGKYYTLDEALANLDEQLWNENGFLRELGKPKQILHIGILQDGLDGLLIAQPLWHASLSEHQQP